MSLALALATTVPGYLIWFAVQPWPAGLVARQMALSTLAMLLLGLPWKPFLPYYVATVLGYFSHLLLDRKF